jgi:hypothetical protein
MAENSTIKLSGHEKGGPICSMLIKKISLRYLIPSLVFFSMFKSSKLMLLVYLIVSL